jgi:hypothetical protein
VLYNKEEIFFVKQMPHNNGAFVLWLRIDLMISFISSAPLLKPVLANLPQNFANFKETKVF